MVADADGTGKKARLEGWRVAGKTGTAQKADAVTGGYSADKRFSSFVGFAPADAPRVVIGVFIDEPKGEVYGGDVAAPVVPRAGRARAQGARGPHHRRRAGGAASPSPGPRGGRRRPTGTRALALASVEVARRRAAPGAGAVAVPVLQGLPARAALRRLESADLAGDIRGSGRVTAQAPRAGEVVKRGTRVRLTLAPPG